MHLHILHCFMKNLIIAGVVVCCIVAGISCSGGVVDRCDANIREAEMALVQGDMRAAESVANHIMGSADTVGLTPTQLCRLSLIYSFPILPTKASVSHSRQIATAGHTMRMRTARRRFMPMWHRSRYHTRLCCPHWCTRRIYPLTHCVLMNKFTYMIL